MGEDTRCSCPACSEPSSVHLSAEDVGWLESVRATITFDPGKKIALDFRRRNDGLIVQLSDWWLDKLVWRARKIHDGPEPVRTALAEGKDGGG